MKKILCLYLSLLLAVTFLPRLLSRSTGRSDDEWVVRDASSQKDLSLSARDFLIGAVFAQTEPGFHTEALKAQAVIAHTNALYDRSCKPDSQTYDFIIDTDRYLSESQARERFGDRYEAYRKKIEQAVDAVGSKYMVYRNRPILAPFFFLCAGKTEAAEAVWGQKVAYLQSAESAGDLLAPAAESRLCFSADRFREVVLSRFPKAELENLSAEILSRTDAGTVKGIEIGNLTMTGQEFRSLFQLPSADFDIVFDGQQAEIRCYGQGHFVGLSLYGADFYARQGMTFDEILKHYYTGISLEA